MAVNTLMIKCRLLLVLALVLAATPAQANPAGGGGRFHPREANRPNAPQRPPQQAQQGPQQQPLSLMNEVPQQFQRRNPGNAGEPQRPRLSPEERRQLRRDIHDAGRDIYPPRR